MSKKQLNGKKKVAEGARNVCVYCGSGLGLNPAYREAAHKLGASLAATDVGQTSHGLEPGQDDAASDRNRSPFLS